MEMTDNDTILCDTCYHHATCKYVPVVDDCENYEKDMGLEVTRLQNQMKKKIMAWLWIRMGDSAEYEKFDAIEEVVPMIKELCPTADFNKAFYDSCSAFYVPPVFEGDNYISLYWGDDNAQIIRPLREKEILDLLQRLNRSKLDDDTERVKDLFKPVNTKDIKYGDINILKITREQKISLIQLSSCSEAYCLTGAKDDLTFTYLESVICWLLDNDFPPDFIKGIVSSAIHYRFGKRFNEICALIDKYYKERTDEEKQCD